MSLPKLAAHPKKEVKLPISGLTATIRPFLIKEEKILVMVKDDNPNHKTMSKAIAEVINAASEGTVKAEKLPLPDLEHLFNQIRCLSKGQVNNLAYRCTAPDKDDPSKKCHTVVQYSIDMSKIVPEIDPKHTNAIPVPNTSYVVKFRYPTMENTEDLLVSNDSTLMQAYEAVISMVDSVINTESGEVFSEFSKEELTDFMDNMPQQFFEDVVDRFANRIPQLRHDIDFECPKCGNKKKIELRGMVDFFAWASPRTQLSRTTR